MSPATLQALTGATMIAGLAWGGAATLVALVAGVAWRKTRGEPAPIHGLLVAGAALLAMAVTREVPAGLWVAVGLLGVAGMLHPLARRVPLLPVLLTVPGAWWLATRGGMPVGSGLGWFLSIMIVIAAPLIVSFDDLDRHRSWGPALWLVTAGGVFAGVPDTEEALVLLGVSLPLLLLGWPLRLVTIGPGAYPMLGVFAWVIAWGGRGRPPSIVGVAAALGVLVLLPIVERSRWARRHRLKVGLGSTTWVGLAHLIVVVVASRAAAPAASVAAAFTVGFGGLLAGAGALFILFDRAGAPPRPPESSLEE